MVASPAADDMSSPKGCGHGHVTHFIILTPRNISAMATARDFKLCKLTRVGHVKY